MLDIKDRLLLILRANTPSSRRAASLSALSGIAAASWQKVLDLKQKPTLEMVQWVAMQWPNYAFWLATGITDARHGHIQCHGHGESFFPERDMQSRKAAKPYFDQAIQMCRRVYGDGLSLHERREFHHEDAIRLLSLELARVAEDEALSRLDDLKLEQELEAETRTHQRLRGKSDTDLLNELAEGMSKLDSERKPARSQKRAVGKK